MILWFRTELYTSPPVPYKGEPNPPNGCDPYCIAMYDDNTAFVDYAPHMDITFYTEDNSYTVNHINRMRMDGSYSDTVRTRWFCIPISSAPPP